MVVMALDHTRDFICNIPFEPENIDQTWGFYFLVRWVTHFCAPAFFFLAGVGASLYGRRHSPGDLQKFLLTRGVWLVVLEFTVIGFAWTFHPGWGMFGVICCLGLSMILLAAFVRLPRYCVMAVALIVIATHDLFDGLKPAAFASGKWLLFVLHRSGGVQLGSTHLFVLFPLIPWCAVTLLGFSMGFLFEGNSTSAPRSSLDWRGCVDALRPSTRNQYLWQPQHCGSPLNAWRLACYANDVQEHHPVSRCRKVSAIAAISIDDAWSNLHPAGHHRSELLGLAWPDTRNLRKSPTLLLHFAFIRNSSRCSAARICHTSARQLALPRRLFSQLPARWPAIRTRISCSLRDVGRRSCSAVLSVRLVCAGEEESSRFAAAVSLNELRISRVRRRKKTARFSQREAGRSVLRAKLSYALAVVSAPRSAASFSVEKASIKSPSLRSLKLPRPMPHSMPLLTSRTSSLTRLSEPILPL